MNLKQFFWTLFCLFIYLGIPAGFWCLMDPHTFWQNLVMVGLTSIWALAAGVGGFFGWIFVAAQLERRRKP